MKILENTVFGSENTAFIYSGLGGISSEGRECLKKIARTLIAIQNRPGAPVPEKIGQEIVRERKDEAVQGKDANKRR